MFSHMANNKENQTNSNVINEKYTFWIDKNVRKEMEKIAKDNRRSLANLINWTLERFLEEQNAKLKISEGTKRESNKKVKKSQR